ncbi:MAG: hypothetical protein DRR04_09905, partial [Gammaproteobacteria bacterium]
MLVIWLFGVQCAPYMGEAVPVGCAPRTTVYGLAQVAGAIVGLSAGFRAAHAASFNVISPRPAISPSNAS